MSNFINRRLAKIERDLEDVRDYLNRQLQKCSLCGSYHTESLIGREADREMEQMLDKVRRWQTEDWGS